MIRTTNIGDNDILLTLLSRELGVIKAFASGAKALKSRRGAATGLLCFSSFHLEKKGDTYRISEAVPIKLFFSAGNDIESLYLAHYFCELSAYICQENSDSAEFLRLILNSLHFLTEKKKSHTLIKAITELRIAAISGYTPNLVGCDGCGKFEAPTMFFNLKEGKIFCESCKKGEEGIPLDPDILKAMRHIVFSEFKYIYSFELSKAGTKKLSLITEKYLTVQTEHSYKTLEFYKSIAG